MVARLRIAWFLVIIVPVTLVLIPIQMVALRFDLALARHLPVMFHRFLCRLLRLKVIVRGEPARDGPLFLLSNHSSWLDIVALSSVMPVSFIAKSEVGTWPIFGTFARLQRSIFVDRSKKMATRDAHQAVGHRLKRGEALVLFAEGTTSDGHRVLGFRSSLVGAAGELVAADGARIQPVAIAYTRRSGLPIARGERPAIAWYGDMDLLPHFGGILAGGPIEVTISFCEALDPAIARERKQATSAAEAIVRNRAAALLRGRVAA